MISEDWKGSLKITQDLYCGIHINLRESPPPSDFEEYLNQLETAKQYKTIWVELTTRHLPILDLCTNKLNYTIHQGLGNTIIIYKWLTKFSDKVVPYSIFWMAAGAVVVNDNKILLVQQKTGARKGTYGIPGGRSDRGELLSQCAERQLFEQTGIKAKFSKVIMMRELTQDQIYGCVDVYVVCLMKLEEGGLEGFKLCPRQISNHVWVPLEQLEEFCQKHSNKTQKLMSKQVARLYRQKRLLTNQNYEHEIDFQKHSSVHRL